MVRTIYLRDRWRLKPHAKGETLHPTPLKVIVSINYTHLIRVEAIPVSESPVRYLVLTAGAGLSLLAACQTSHPPDPLPGGTEFRCAAGELQGLIGQPETVLESMSFGPSVWLRVLQPNDAMSLDFQVNRTNIAIAEDGVISDIHCS